MASLAVMTAELNRTKSDDDPADWIPQAATCHFTQTYDSAKDSYSLSIDKAGLFASWEVRRALAQAPHNFESHLAR